MDASFGPSDSTLVLSQGSELSELTSPPGSPSTSGCGAKEALPELNGGFIQGYAGEFIMALNTSEDDPWLGDNQDKVKTATSPMFDEVENILN